MRNILYISLIISGLLLSAFSQAYSQKSVAKKPYSYSHALKAAELPKVALPAIDLKKLQEEDKRDDKNGLPPRFGFPNDVSLNLNNAGHWEKLPNGDRLWRLTLHCPNALSINLLYDKFWIPEGGMFHLYNQQRSHLLGGFTQSNNQGTQKAPGKFATGLVYGHTITLEYYEPANVTGQGIIAIDYVVHGYRQIGVLQSFTAEAGFGDSGSCQVNVNCSPEGNNWQDEKTGVALILSNGTRWCTGSLINNVQQNGRPYLLTADHCLTNGADAINNPNLGYWTFYWNYESSGCANGSDFTPPTTTGATVVANNSDSDFALLLLDESPADIGVNAYFNGWDCRDLATTSGVGIHHPAGDIKKIATHTQTPANSSSIPPGRPDANFWQVQWSATTNGFSVTEGGSSGSPLFNANSHIIGQLYGGSSINCSDPANDPGVYGKLFASWNANDPRRRLRDWLDPTNTGVNTLNGGYLSGCVTNLNITNTIAGNTGSHLFTANNTITASNVINSPTQVTYRAGSTVTLLPGFEVQANVGFLAHLGNCVARTTRSPITFTSSAKTETTKSFKSQSLFLYPNPTQGTFTIVVPEGKASDNRRIGVYNLMGIPIIDREINSSKTIKVDLTQHLKGIYLVKYFSGNQIITKKVVYK